MISASATHICHCHAKTAVDNTETDDRDGVQTKYYLRTLKFEFHTIVTSHKILFFFSPNHLKM